MNYVFEKDSFIYTCDVDIRVCPMLIAAPLVIAYAWISLFQICGRFAYAVLLYIYRNAILSKSKGLCKFEENHVLHDADLDYRNCMFVYLRCTSTKNGTNIGHDILVESVCLFCWERDLF